LDTLLERERLAPLLLLFGEASAPPPPRFCPACGDAMAVLQRRCVLSPARLLLRVVPREVGEMEEPSP